MSYSRPGCGPARFAMIGAGTPKLMAGNAKLGQHGGGSYSKQQKDK